MRVNLQHIITIKYWNISVHAIQQKLAHFIYYIRRRKREENYQFVATLTINQEKNLLNRG